ncbi:hypothetical protein OG458_42425 (plasmid) [Streptomyces sp. NBC_01281]|uniref:hypothetical protein n=1 Tax=Streptomyces sp. NBC_01281 TaxID=2903811 RepID=UPI002E1058E7|nr:hypothetical protein OG458_41380 [Streptomyces sp. NBC_01281]WSK66613.1 hypothetical protein OG458_42425 [Streptomyces sp. NBC_01281]
MVRGEPSGADRELIERLAALDVVVSAAQLERWRAAGLLPGHQRVWLGRGRGSVSVLAEESVPVAAALGRHACPGRDLRWTVIAWYAEAGRPVLPGALPVPEPPWPAVREALVWAVSRSQAQRLVVAARAAAEGSEAEQDDFYVRTARVVGRGPAGPADPSKTRRVFEDPGFADREFEPERGEDLRRRRGMTRLAAAFTMGAGEVGGEALVDAMATFMPGLDTAALARAAREAEESGTLEEWTPAGAVDLLARLDAVGAEELAAARRAAVVIAGVGGLYLLHGLGMPDNPVLARVRQLLEESGFSLIAAQMAPLMLSPSGIVQALVMCLSPQIGALAAWLESVLAEQAATGKGLLRLPGREQDGPEAFMRSWIDRINQVAERSRARRGSDDALHGDVADQGPPAPLQPALPDHPA